MAYRFTDLPDLAAAGFDELIDVRSPAEFAEDHLPGARNLPVLSDAERAEVGTLYVQHSRFEARRRGAALLARNVAMHLEGPLADKPPAYRPLIYCWRGGQRSGGMATILGQIGWRVEVLEGGYRSYRRAVVAALYDGVLPHAFILLDGYTGCAKTALLDHLAARGVQVLDLEGLAVHRGSLFGGFAERDQPSQKAFDSRVMAALADLDPGRPVVVEAESSRIGSVTIPPALWARLKPAPRVEVTAPLAARARYLTTAYADICADTGRLLTVLDRLATLQPAERIAAWRELACAGEHEALAAGLMELHYDPAYRRSRARREGAVLPAIALPSLDETALRDGAALVEVAIDALTGAAPVSRRA
ncbi:MAG: tRNA 2-selenouridine(34) synthase MnmH [Pseudomonadota bacterium]